MPMVQSKSSWIQTVKPPLGTPRNLDHWMADGLLAHWLMRPGIGGVADEYLFNRSGPLLNGAAFVDQGVSFDGVNDQIRVGRTGLEPVRDCTYTVIFKRIGLQGTFGSVLKHGPNTDRFRAVSFQFNSTSDSDIKWFVNTSAVVSVASGPGAIIDEHIYRMVGTYDGANITLYLDGVQVDSAAQTGDIEGYGSPGLVIGNQDSSSPGLKGVIYDCRAYQRAWSAQEVAQWYINSYADFQVRRYYSFAAAGVGAALAGDLEYSLNHAATLQIGKPLVGDLSYSLAHAGTIQIGQFLSGALAYSLTHAGDIQIGKFLAGDLDYSLTHTGDISIGKLLAGDLAYSLTEAGTIQVGKLLAGVLSYTLTEAGTLQVGKFLAGALSYSLTHEGTLLVGGVDLVGDLAYSLSHAGTLEIGKFLAGALVYSLTHTGDLEIGKFLAGALVYSLTHAGTLAVGGIELAGDLAYSLTELGDIQIGQFLAGALAYSLTEVGTIEIGKFLEGALNYSLTEAGTLTLDILLSGALNYSLTDTGNLQIGQLFAGNLSYSLTETGDIQIGINLVGQETITLTLSGTLSVTAAIFRVLIRLNEALATPSTVDESLSIQKTTGENLIA